MRFVKVLDVAHRARNSDRWKWKRDGVPEVKAKKEDADGEHSPTAWCTSQVRKHDHDEDCNIANHFHSQNGENTLMLAYWVCLGAEFKVIIAIVVWFAVLIESRKLHGTAVVDVYGEYG